MSAFGSAPTFILLALILAIIGLFGWAVYGIFLVLDEDLFAIYAFVAVGVLIWTVVRTSAIRAAMEQGDALTAARLNTVPFGVIATLFGNVISGILILVSIGSIQEAAGGPPSYQAPSGGPSQPAVAGGPQPTSVPPGDDRPAEGEGSAAASSETVVCSNCGATNPQDHAFCKDCGAKLA